MQRQHEESRQLVGRDGGTDSFDRLLDLEDTRREDKDIAARLSGRREAMCNLQFDSSAIGLGPRGGRQLTVAPTRPKSIFSAREATSSACRARTSVSDTPRWMKLSRMRSSCACVALRAGFPEGR